MLLNIQQHIRKSHTTKNDLAQGVKSANQGLETKADRLGSPEKAGAGGQGSKHQVQLTPQNSKKVQELETPSISKG